MVKYKGSAEEKEKMMSELSAQLATLKTHSATSSHDVSIQTVVPVMSKKEQVHIEVEETIQELVVQPPTPQILDLYVMEEDTTTPEPTNIVEDKDTNIKSLEGDITQENDKIVELENAVRKKEDDVSDLKK